MMQWIDFMGPSFKLSVPSTWTSIGTMEFQVAFLSPQLPDDERRVNLGVLLQAREGRELTAYTQQLLQEQAANYPQFQSTPMGEGGLLFKNEWVRPDDFLRVVQWQAFFADEEMVYILTGSRPSELDLADEVDAIFHTMIGSFQLQSASWA